MSHNAYYQTMDYPFRVMDIIEDKSDHLQFKKGQMIYCEGSTPLGAYFVREGKAKIKKIASDGKEQIINIATPGEMLSYIDLVSNTRYSTSAIALEDSVLLFLPKQMFWSLIKDQGNLFDSFVQLISQDLRHAEEKITDLAYKPVRSRLADALITLARKFENGSGSQSVAITRYDLACFVGTVKETVNRVLSDFRNEKLIMTDGTKIVILDANGLSRAAA